MIYPDKQHFFIAGPPKGGTTWLMRLMDAHPEASCSGEGHYFDRLRPLLAQLMGEYKKLMDLDAKLVFSGKPVLGPLKQSHITAMLRAFVLQRFAEHDPAGRAKAHGDKTPLNWKAMNELFQAFPDAKLLFINRDPRDAAVSLFGHAKRRQLYKLDPEGPIDRDTYIRASCRNWIGMNKALASIRAEKPDALVYVTYEDLLADTLGEYGRICAALGLSTKAKPLEKAVEACSFGAMSGRKAGERDESSFFTSGTSGGWQEALSADEADLVERLCGEYMGVVGYMA